MIELVRDAGPMAYLIILLAGLAGPAGVVAILLSLSQKTLRAAVNVPDDQKQLLLAKGYEEASANTTLGLMVGVAPPRSADWRSSRRELRLGGAACPARG